MSCVYCGKVKSRKTDLIQHISEAFMQDVNSHMTQRCMEPLLEPFLLMTTTKMGYKKLIDHLVTGRVHNTYKRLIQKSMSCDSTRKHNSKLVLAITILKSHACHPVCMQADIELYILQQLLLMVAGCCLLLLSVVYSSLLFPYVSSSCLLLPTASYSSLQFVSSSC